MYNLLTEAADVLHGMGFTSSHGVVLFASEADQLPDLSIKMRIDYADVLHMPSGLQGEFLLTELNSKPLMLSVNSNVAGRNHSLRDLIFPLRVMYLLGNRYVFLVNRSVSWNKQLHPGDMVLLEDHISFLKDSPLTGPNIDELGPRFPDMSAPYDGDLQKQAMAIASTLGLKVKRGVYAVFPGSESPDEEMSFAGADCAGNTLVPEVITGRHMNMKICGLSIIVENLASNVDFSHAIQLIDGILTP